MVVWITGASSGIGEATAYEYARCGSYLVLTSSSEERLKPVADKCRALGAAGVGILPFDLQNVAQIESLSQRAWEMFHGIDILFCNAGISQRTTVEETSMEMLNTLMAVDFFAPAAMAKAVLPQMVAAGGGHIAVTTSIAGKFGFPLRCGYSAAKHALDGFFETLQAEYAGKGIRVTLVCPGRVRTNISVNALDKGGRKHGVMDAGQAGGITAEKAARQIVCAVAKGKREVLVGGRELLMVYVKRFFPSLCAHIAQRIKPM